MQQNMLVLARNDNVFDTFAPYVASINDNGTTVFQATQPKRTGIYAHNGSTTETIIECEPHEGTFCSHPVINRAGTIGIFRKAPHRSSLFVTSLHRGRSSPLHFDFSEIGPLGPTINEAGAIAFRATHHNLACIAVVENNTVRIVATEESFAAFHGLPLIDASGRVYFRATTHDRREVIARSEAQSSQLLVTTPEHFTNLGNFPSLTHDGSLLFAAQTREGKSGLFQWSDGTIRCVKNEDGTFANVRGGLLQNRHCAFYATPYNGTLGLYFGTEDAHELVFAAGTPWEGSNIEEFVLNPVSMNVHGSIVVRVRLQNHRELLLRIDP